MESVARRPGWGRTVLSTYWHWFDDDINRADGDSTEPRQSVCETIGSYKGDLVPDIARWRIDPSVCEICREIRVAHTEGRVSRSTPLRTIAIVPPGLPERIRVFMDSPPGNGNAAPPFYVALDHFRSEGVTKPILSALLRYDAGRTGRISRTPAKWWDITLDEVREVEGTARVRIERQAKRAKYGRGSTTT